MKIPTFEAGIDTNGIHMDSDKNDLYVLLRCILYLQRHLGKYLCFDMETMKLICWILGEDMQLLGNFLLSIMGEKAKAKFEPLLIRRQYQAVPTRDPREVLRCHWHRQQGSLDSIATGGQGRWQSSAWTAA